MEKIEHKTDLSGSTNPILTLIIILLLSFVGFQALGPFIGFLFALPFIGLDLQAIMEMATNPMGSESYKVPLFIVQGVASFIGFIIIPLLYLRFAVKKPMAIFFEAKSLKSYPVMLLTLLVLCFMFLNSVFIEWNANFKFPEALAGLETQLRKFEDLAKAQTEFLTSFNSTGHFVLAFVVIAVIPAIGEELLFRGFVQNLLHKSTGNIHLAIWIAGFIFSAFHMQFYGLVPRMLLGALFGYLYYWSRSLSTAMIAHFINNGFTIIMMYLYQKGLVDVDVETEESLPFTGLLVLFILFSGLTFLYHKYFHQKKQLDEGLANGV